MKLNNVAVYNIMKVLKVAREKEAKKHIIKLKRLRNRPRKRLIKKLKEENKEKVLKILFSDLNIK